MKRSRDCQVKGKADLPCLCFTVRYPRRAFRVLNAEPVDGMRIRNQSFSLKILRKTLLKFAL